MRSLHALALALSLVSVTTAASADDPVKPKKPKKTTAAAAPKKLASARRAPAKKPPPAKVAEPAIEEEPTPASEPEPTLNAPEDDATPRPSAASRSSSPRLARPSADTTVDAEPPAPMASMRHPFSAAPLLGVSSGYLRYGVGARAGYTLSSHVYLGAAFMYQFGETAIADALGVPAASAHAFYPSFEGGYDLQVGPVVIRPYLGVALVFRTLSTPAVLDVPPSSVTSASVAIYPGGAVSYDIPKTPIFVGADARLLFDFDIGTSFAVSMSAGVRF